MNLKEKLSIETLLEGIDLSGLFENEDALHGQLNLWIPLEYKEKYKKIQSRSKKKFIKVIQKAAMILIDKADSELGKAS